MRFYRLLLHLYPASFRNEYAEQMADVFAHRRGEVSGTLAVPSLWIATLLEVASNAVLVHWDVTRQDLHYTGRILRRTPGFAVTAVLLVALGIGATTAAFSVTDFVLLRPLPFPEPNRLVKIWERTPGYSRMELSPANYRDWKQASRSFDRIGAYYTLAVNVVGRGEPLRLERAVVSSDLFPTLGVQPILGRTFRKDDDREGAPGTVILGNRLWQAQFGGRPGAIGQHVTLDNDVYTVIGVMPGDFHFPSSDESLWTTMRFGEGNYQDRNDNFLEVVGRLREGVTIDAARVEWGVLAARWRQAYPKENRQVDDGAIHFYSPKDLVIRTRSTPAALLPAIRSIVRRVDPRQPISDVQTLTEIVESQTASRSVQLRVIAGFAAIAFLLAAIGIHGLLSFAVSQRAHEISIRMALGARANDILHMVVRRSVVLAVAGAIPGLGLAYAAGRAMQGFLVGVTPADGLTYLAVAGMVVVMTIAGTVIPTRRALGLDPIAALRIDE